MNRFEVTNGWIKRIDFPAADTSTKFEAIKLSAVVRIMSYETRDSEDRQTYKIYVETEDKRFEFEYAADTETTEYGKDLETLQKAIGLTP